MKVLEVSSLHQGIQQLIDSIEKQYNEIDQVLAAVNELISLEDAFKGEGEKRFELFTRNVIRSLSYSINSS